MAFQVLDVIRAAFSVESVFRVADVFMHHGPRSQHWNDYYRAGQSQHAPRHVNQAG
ncbi:MAG: hypothetical protein ACRDRG_21815 [Pseudonocardiaceae bacterium]